jgi:hypothetical protein
MKHAKEEGGHTLMVCVKDTGTFPRLTMIRTLPARPEYGGRSSLFSGRVVRTFTLHFSYAQ